MKCEKISPSRASLYEQCALRYKVKYEDGIRQPGSVAMDAGNFAHKVLELYYRPPFDFDVEESFDMAKREENCADFDEFEEAMRMVVDTISSFPRDDALVIDTEVEMEHTFDSGITILGKIDMLRLKDATTMEVIDYKSGRFVPTIGEMRASHQTNMYPLWVYESGKFPEIERIVFSYYYIRTGLRKSIEVPYNRVQEYRVYLEFLVEQILRNDTPSATLNTFCWNCPFRKECPEFQRVQNGEEFYSFENEDGSVSLEAIIEASLKISYALTSLKREKKRIDDWVAGILKDRGIKSIKAGGKTAHLSSKKSIKYDANLVQKLADERGVSEHLINVSSGAVRNAFKGDKHALDILESSAIREEGTPYLTIK